NDPIRACSGRERFRVTKRIFPASVTATTAVVEAEAVGLLPAADADQLEGGLGLDLEDVLARRHVRVDQCHAEPVRRGLDDRAEAELAELLPRLAVGGHALVEAALREALLGDLLREERAHRGLARRERLDPRARALAGARVRPV